MTDRRRGELQHPAMILGAPWGERGGRDRPPAPRCRWGVLLLLPLLAAPLDVSGEPWLGEVWAPADVGGPGEVEARPRGPSRDSPSLPEVAHRRINPPLRGAWPAGAPPPGGGGGEGSPGGEGRPPTRLYLGMWSVHLRDLSPHPTTNHLVALSHDGFFAGTFINSFDDRGMAAGVQRDLIRWGGDGAATSLGWRAGLVTGYDERLLGGLGGRTPVLPFLQVLWNVDWRRVGVEFSYSGIVVSAATNVRLGGGG